MLETGSPEIRPDALFPSGLASGPQPLGLSPAHRFLRYRHPRRGAWIAISRISAADRSSSGRRACGNRLGPAAQKKSALPVLESRWQGRCCALPEPGDCPWPSPATARPSTLIVVAGTTPTSLASPRRGLVPSDGPGPGAARPRRRPFLQAEGRQRDRCSCAMTEWLRSPGQLVRLTRRISRRPTACPRPEIRARHAARARS